MCKISRYFSAVWFHRFPEIQQRHSSLRLENFKTRFNLRQFNSGQQMAWNENPSEGAKRLARRTGCGTQFQQGSVQFAECLRNLPVQDIIDAAAEESFVDFVWSPVVDGIFLPEPPSREYMNQKGLTDRFNFMITERRISTKSPT